MAAAQDVRCDVRIEATCRVRYSTMDELVVAESRDLSPSGMFLTTSRFLPLNSVLPLALELPASSRAVSLIARVAHLRTPAEVAPGLPAGMGVEFTAMPAEAAQRIQSCVGKLRASRPPRTTLTPRPAPSPEDFELLRRLCWILARSALADRPLEEVLGVPGEAPREARREMFRKLRGALGLDHPPPFLGTDDRWELERRLRMIETMVDTAD